MDQLFSHLLNSDEAALQAFKAKCLAAFILLGRSLLKVRKAWDAPCPEQQIPTPLPVCDNACFPHVLGLTVACLSAEQAQPGIQAEWQALPIE